MATAVAQVKGVSVSTEMADDIFDMAGAGADFSSEEMQMPFVRIAQAMSPEIKKSDAKFIEGCGQGDIFNNLTQEYWGDGVELIPCYVQTKYTEWVSLDDGGGFVGEILILLGAFQKNFLVAILASIGVVLGAAYMLWLYKRVIFGKLEKKELTELKDLNLSEGVILFILAGLTLFFGFYPNLILDTIHVSVEKLINDYQMNLILNTIK